MPRRSFSARFGQVLRRRREAAGLSQERLAELASIHRTHVGLLERGQRGASLDVAKALAGALDEELSALIAEAEALA